MTRGFITHKDRIVLRVSVQWSATNAFTMSSMTQSPNELGPVLNALHYTAGCQDLHPSEEGFRIGSVEKCGSFYI
ncbi:MAG: hypothetical protein AB1733_14015 [Thermodesulfobacteriota bacterium]